MNNNFNVTVNWHKFILTAKENTVIGGFHIIQLFTDQVPASPDIAPFAVGLASNEELRNYIMIGTLFNLSRMYLKMNILVFQNIYMRQIKL